MDNRSPRRARLSSCFQNYTNYALQLLDSVNLKALARIWAVLVSGEVATNVTIANADAILKQWLSQERASPEAVAVACTHLTCGGSGRVGFLCRILIWGVVVPSYPRINVDNFGEVCVGDVF